MQVQGLHPRAFPKRVGSPWSALGPPLQTPRSRLRSLATSAQRMDPGRSGKAGGQHGHWHRITAKHCLRPVPWRQRVPKSRQAEDCVHSSRWCAGHYALPGHDESVQHLPDRGRFLGADLRYFSRDQLHHPAPGGQLIAERAFLRRTENVHWFSLSAQAEDLQVKLEPGRGLNFGGPHFDAEQGDSSMCSQSSSRLMKARALYLSVSVRGANGVLSLRLKAATTQKLDHGAACRTSKQGCAGCNRSLCGVLY